MLLANLKIFFANIARHGLFTAINVLGLSIGLASCLLISLYVLDEFSYDSQHPAADRLYRMSSILVGVEQGGRIPIPSAPMTGPLLQQNFAEVEAFTRMTDEPVYLSLGSQGYYEDAVNFVDPNFFSFFQLNWLEGDPASALSLPDAIVLTRSLALKYFGDINPVGQQLQLQNVGPLQVTGLIDDLSRTHFSGDAFVTMNTLQRLAEPDMTEDWFSARFQVYLRLQEGASFAQLQPQFHTFLDRQMPPAAKAIYDADSMPVRDIHLSEPQFLGLNGETRRTEVLTLMLVCAALLASPVSISSTWRRHAPVKAARKSRCAR